METTMQIVGTTQQTIDVVPTSIETAETSVEVRKFVSIRFKAFKQKGRQVPTEYKRVELDYSKQVRFTFSVIQYLTELAAWIKALNVSTLYEPTFSIYAHPYKAKTIDFVDDQFAMQMAILETVVLIHGNEETMKNDLIQGRPQMSTEPVVRNIAQSFVGRQKEVNILKLAASIRAQRDFGNKVVKAAEAEAKHETLTKKQQVVLQQIAIKAKERRAEIKDYKVIAVRGIALLKAANNGSTEE